MAIVTDPSTPQATRRIAVGFDGWPSFVEDNGFSERPLSLSELSEMESLDLENAIQAYFKAQTDTFMLKMGILHQYRKALRAMEKVA